MRTILDTNVVIYLQKGMLAEPMPVGEYFISVITEMELLSFPHLTGAQREWLMRFIQNVTVINIDSKVKRIAIDIRSQHHVRLPDAIIAASAIAIQGDLLSNDRGLQSIPDLNVKALPLKASNG